MFTLPLVTLTLCKAFRKTDKTSLGDDSKKTSEWVLEPFAIKDGVTPTTRYRKNGKKTVKSSNPAPARVRSGRAGGLSAGKAKFERRKYQGGGTGVPPKENRRSQSQNQHLMAANNRYHDPSPSIPNNHEFTSIIPYHFNDTSFGDRTPFEDVQGIHMDDGPVFCVDGFEYNGEKHLQMWSEFHC